MPPDQLFDTMAVRIRSEDVDGVDVTINMTFHGHDEQWVLGLANHVINYTSGRHDPDADATVTVRSRTMVELATDRTTIDDAITAGHLTIEGDSSAFATIIDNLVVFLNNFTIVEP